MPSLPSVFPHPGPYSPSLLEEQLGEFKERLQTLGLKESPSYRAGEPGGWHSSGPKGKHMSQRQAVSAQAGNGPNESTPLSPKTRPSLPPITVYPSSEGRGQHEREAGSPAVSRPSPRDRPSGPFAEPRNTKPRNLGVHSILNPSHASDETASQRASVPPESYPHRSTSESPASSNGPLTPGKSFPPINGLPSPHMPNARHAIPSGLLASRGPGGGAINTPTGSIDAKKSPFISNADRGSYHPMEVGQGHGPPPVGARPMYHFPQQTLIKSEDRRGSDASQMMPSQSNSPTTSLTSYGTGPGSRTSPVVQYSQCGVGPGEHLKKLIGAPPGSTHGASANGSGQGTYQLMTIDTDQGPVQFPVDVQAASKVADEKRKRNAGASARFRARRKEKEREASQTISRLESKVQELRDDKEFYRMERDYFRQLVYNSPAHSQVVTRPPSPPQRKLSIDTSSTGTPEWSQNGERGSEDGRNQRRRISGYYEASPIQGPPPTLAQGPPPTSHNPHAVYQAPQPAYGFTSDARSRHPPPHDRPSLPGHPPLPGPPLRAGHYEAGIPPGYERPYYPHRA